VLKITLVSTGSFGGELVVMCTGMMRYDVICFEVWVDEGVSGVVFKCGE